MPLGCSADLPMLVLSSLYFKSIRNDATVPDSKWWLMFVSSLTSAFMIAHKLGQIASLIGRLKEYNELTHQRTQLLESVGLDPAGAPLLAHAQSTAGPNAPANHAVHQAPEFVGGPHVASAGAAPILANLQHAYSVEAPPWWDAAVEPPAHHPPPPASVFPAHLPAHHPPPPTHARAPQPHHAQAAPKHHAPAVAKHPPAQSQAQVAAVRGRCDGCGTNVMDQDTGRVREGDKYFHGHCVKGECGGCGLVVHANSVREIHGNPGVYWHSDCWRTAGHHL